jgi:hypothetical protein
MNFAKNTGTGIKKQIDWKINENSDQPLESFIPPDEPIYFKKIKLETNFKKVELLKNQVMFYM